MDCPICNSELVEYITNSPIPSYAHYCLSCNSIISTEQDQKDTIEGAYKAIGKLVYVDNICSRFYPFSKYINVQLRIINIHICHTGSILCDLSLVDSKEMVLEKVNHFLLSNI